MFIYWLYHLCLYSFLLFLPPVTSFVFLTREKSPFSYSCFNMMCLVSLFLSPSVQLLSLFCFVVSSSLHVLFQRLIHDSGFLLDLCVSSFPSALPAPLQTFCCTHTPPSLIFVSSLFHLLASHSSFSQRNEVCVFSCVLNICTLI